MHLVMMVLMVGKMRLLLLLLLILLVGEMLGRLILLRTSLPL